MTKTELKKIIYLDMIINSKIKQLENLRAKRFSITGPMLRDDYTPAPKFGGGSKEENLVIKILDFEAEINKDIDRLIDLKRRAKREIDKLDEPYCAVLTMRYLEGLKWDKIADRMGYSLRAVYRIHGIALEILKSV